MDFDQVTVNGVNSNGEKSVEVYQEVRKITRREKEIIGNFVFMIQFIIGMI